MTPERRRALVAAIDVMITLLDALDPDPDIEDEGDREGLADAEDRLFEGATEREGDYADGEPSLASPEAGFPAGWSGGAGCILADVRSSQLKWARGSRSDGEEGIDDEPHDPEDDADLGWANEGSQAGLHADLSGVDQEPWLGALESMSGTYHVRGWAAPTTARVLDAEQDVQNEPHDEECGV